MVKKCTPTAASSLKHCDSFFMLKLAWVNEARRTADFHTGKIACQQESCLSVSSKHMANLRYPSDSWSTWKKCWFSSRYISLREATLQRTYVFFFGWKSTLIIWDRRNHSGYWGLWSPDFTQGWISVAIASRKHTDRFLGKSFHGYATLPRKTPKDTNLPGPKLQLIGNLLNTGCISGIEFQSFDGGSCPINVII